jgi:ubiquinone/menaquinone biosynthesis C-methylase UbiE
MWSQRAATFDDRRYDVFRFLQRALISTVKISPPATFLDLGCGTGWAVRYVADLLRGEGKFIGIDLSNGMIQKAKSHSTGRKEVEFCQGSAESLPFGEDYFTTVICSNSFHHYLQPVEALREVRRALKPGGRVHILDITADDPLIRRIDQRVKAREEEHVKFYSSMEFAAMMEAAGLNYLGSRRLKILYPLTVHVGEKENKLLGLEKE